MSRSLSWFDPQELDALFSQIGVSEEGAAPTRGAPTSPPTAPAGQQNTALSSMGLSDENAPFNRSVRQFRDQQRLAGPLPPSAPPFVPPSTSVPTLLPMSEPGPAGLRQAVQAWDATGALPAFLVKGGYPACYKVFLGWLLIAAEAQAGFLADEQGLPLAMQGTDESAPALSASFAQADLLLRHTDLGAGNQLRQIQVPLDSGQIWHLGWATSSHGTVAWGLKLHNHISVELTTSISSMLVAVLEHSANHIVSNRS